MEAARRHAPLTVGRAHGGNRLLRLASDERLVARARAGSEQAFEVLYERHYRNILSFCRHMLGTLDEAEDAVQQTFINAYRHMVGSDKELRFRPWLYRIARNQCISALRARRMENELDGSEPSLAGLSEQIAGREELRYLLADLATLPSDQREALLLAELHDNSHAEVAEILGCDREKVKSLVFQARSSLLKSREAREVSCEEIRRQLSVLRGGALRRNVIRRHLRRCEACRAFRREIKTQRRAIAVLLPVIPSPGLKLGAANLIAASGVVAAQGSAAGGGLSGPLTALAGKLGLPAVLLKGAAATVAVTVVAAGGTVAVQEAVKDRNTSAHPPGVREPLPGSARGIRAPIERLPAGRRVIAPRRGKANGHQARGRARGLEPGRRVPPGLAGTQRGRGARQAPGRAREQSVGRRGLRGGQHVLPPVRPKGVEREGLRSRPTAPRVKRQRHLRVRPPRPAPELPLVAPEDSPARLP